MEEAEAARREVFDFLANAGGMVVVVVLVVPGGLFIWGYSFTNSNVHNQLAQQHAYFPPKAALPTRSPAPKSPPA